MTPGAKNPLSPEQAALLRQVPSVDELLQRPQITELCREYNREYVVSHARGVLEILRREILAEQSASEPTFSMERIELRVVASLENEMKPSLREVINASGVILHTNLGR